MYAMPYGDDLDERFNELVAQIDGDEQRKMRTAARKAAKEVKAAARTSRRRPRPRLSPYDARPPRRIGRTWLAMATITAVIGAAGLIVTFRPDLLSPAGGPVPEEIMPVVEDGWLEEVAVPGNPFAGTPAESWAEGAAGFVMPAARGMGGLSQQDVAEGLERTRALLAAAYLDKETLLGGRPDAFARLLHPDQRRSFLIEVKEDGRRFVNSFAPKTAEFATDAIKVNGRATLSTFKDSTSRGVKVTLNYLIAYAVHRPGQPMSTIRVVSHSRGNVLMHRESGRLVVWVEDLSASSTPARCDVEDAFIHPYYDDSPEDKVPATGAPVDPYALDAPDDGPGCGTAQPT